MINIDVLYSKLMNDIPIFNQFQSLQFEKTNLFKINKSVNILIGDTNNMERLLELNDTTSDIIISNGVDQHTFNIDYSIFNKYKYKIIICDEPVYSSVSLDMSIPKHEEFIRIVNPDLVCYTSLIDTVYSPAKKSIPWYSLLDIYKNEQNSLNVKTNSAILAYVNDSWWKDRKLSIEMIRNVCEKYNIDLSVHSGLNYFTLCDEVSKSKIQFIPAHSIYIHPIRFIQTWMMGSIPIVVGSSGWMENENVKETHSFFFENNFKTCILTDVDKCYEDLSILYDLNVIDNMISNLKNLDLTQFNSVYQINQIYNIINENNLIG